MKLKFSASDFQASPLTKIISIEYAASVAQQIFDDYVAKCPVVYTHHANTLNKHSWYYYKDRTFDGYYTHRARLIEVEEIPKKECEHKAAAPTAAAGIYFCIECDRKLKWTVVE